MGDRGNMCRATRFQRDIYDCIAQANAVVSTAVQRLDDVCPLLGEDLSQLKKSSRAIGEVDAYAHPAAVFGQTAFDDSGRRPEPRSVRL
jgi:hypothetical protein